MTGHQGPSARDIAQMLRSHAESVGLMIFPGARKAGGFLNIGSLHGEPGDSLKIRLTGPKVGTWADYAESKGHPLGTGDMLKLTFPFAAPTPAAVFRRADMLWMVFDSKAKIDLAAVRGDPRGIRNVSQRRGADGEEIIRIQLDRPRLISATAEAGTWTIEVADTLVRPPQPLLIARSVVGRDRANIVIPFVKASAVHRLRDPEIGDRLVVVTALAPPRGFLKDQHFVELRTLSSSQGVVVQPIADDVTAAIAPDKITISRPHGLSLSATALAQEQGGGVSFQDVTFDPEIWGFDQHAQFFPRQTELLNKAAVEKDPAKRKEFYDEFQMIVGDDLPIYWINALPYHTVYDKRLGNVPESIWGSMQSMDDVYWKKA